MSQQQNPTGILPPTVSQLSGMSTSAVRGSLTGSQGSALSGSSYTVLSNPSALLTSRGNSTNDGSYFHVAHNGGDSSLTDITLEQALSKLTELAMENASLKDYVKDNTEKMKKQFELLSQWKEKVRDTNQQYLRRLQETARQVTDLRADNEELKHRLAPSNTQGSIAGELHDRIRRLEKEKEDTQCEASQLQQKLEELKGQISSKMADSDMVFVENDDANQKLCDENETFKLRCMELGTQVQNFHQQNEQLMQDLQHLNSQNQVVQSENTKLNADNLNLQKQMQSFLGNMKQTKHSLGGTAEVYKTYDYSMVNSPQDEGETKSSLTAKQDMEILEMQTAAVEDLKSGEAAEHMAQIRDTLQMQRKLTAEQKQQLGSSDVMISKLESQLQEKDQMLMHYKQQLESQVATVTEEHERQQQELLRQLGGLNTELHQTKSSMQHPGEVQNLKSQVLHLLNEAKESSARLDAATKALDKKSTRIVELDHHIGRKNEEMQKSRMEADALIQSLRYSLKSYEDALGRERGEHATTKKQHTELRASFNQLVNDYKELLDTFDEQKVQQPAQQPGAPNKQQMDDINRLTAQTIAAEEAITYRDEQIRQLKAENARFKEEIDNTVPVLQAQAEVWKQDFDAERYARERQVQEKDAVLQEMKSLEIRNQQLLDEIENFQRQSLAEMQRRHVPGSHQQQMQTYLQYNQSPAGGYPQYPQPGAAVYPPQTGYPQGQPIEYPARNVPSPASPRPPVTPPPAPSPPQTGSQGSSGSQEGELMACPKCGIACPDLDTLQIHVLDCIDN